MVTSLLAWLTVSTTFFAPRDLAKVTLGYSSTTSAIRKRRVNVASVVAPSPSPAGVAPAAAVVPDDPDDPVVPVTPGAGADGTTSTWMSVVGVSLGVTVSEATALELRVGSCRADLLRSAA